MIEAPPEDITFFDALLEELRRANLEQHATIVEKATIQKYIHRSAWRTIQAQPTVTGEGDWSRLAEFRKLEQHLRQIAVAPNQRFARKFATFTFLIRPALGCSFGYLEGLRKLGSQTTATIDGVSAEVTLVVFWTTSIWQCEARMRELEYLAEVNESAWEGRVRFIAINCGGNESVAMNIVETYKWTRFEHYTAEREDRLIVFENVPAVFLIDRNGRLCEITQTRELRGLPSWEEKINGLLNSQPEVTSPKPVEPQEKEPEMNRLDQGCWLKFRQVIESVKQEPPPASNFKIICKRERTWNNGKVEIVIDPLTISYETSPTQVVFSEELAKEIASQLNPQEYLLRPTVVADQEAQLQSIFDLTLKTLQREGVKGSPVIERTWTMEVKHHGTWTHKTSILLPKIENQDPQLLKKMRMIAQELSFSYVKVRVDVPASNCGSRFAGIKKLKELDSEQEAAIQSQQGLVQLIAFFPHRRERMAKVHINKLIEIVEASSKNVLLHIVSESFSDSTFAKAIHNRNLPKVRLYRTRFSANQQIAALGFDGNNFFTVVVDQLGTVRQCGELMDYPLLKKYLNGEDQLVAHETIDTVDWLSESDILKNLEQEISKLDYKMKVILEYTEYKLGPKEKSNKFDVPKLECSVRESDRHLLQPLISRLGKVVVVEEVIQTIELPLGSECIDCHNILKLPYYYFFVSKVYRCVQCTKVERVTVEKLQRYPVLENSVLITGDWVVDILRFGDNLQPKEENNCLQHNFSCDGCGSGSRGGVRHICMGCKREPNNSDYVDFCVDCVAIMVGNDQQAKLNILNRCKEHSLKHPLLRVLYNTSGYYDF